MATTRVCDYCGQALPDPPSVLVRVPRADQMGRSVALCVGLRGTAAQYDVCLPCLIKLLQEAVAKEE